MTIAGTWMLSRADGEPINDEYGWLAGGDGPEPDWSWIDADDFWVSGEVLAERFAPTARVALVTE